MDEYIAAIICGVCARYQIFPEHIESFHCLNIPIKMSKEFFDIFSYMFPLHAELLMKMYKTIIFETLRELIFCPDTTDVSTILTLKSKIPELCYIIDNGLHIFQIATTNSIDDLKIIYSGVSPERNMLSEIVAVGLSGFTIIFLGSKKVQWLYETFKIPENLHNMISGYYNTHTFEIRWYVV